MNPAVGLFLLTISRFLQIYTALVIVRILLSWFPTVNWFSPPFSILSQLVDPYLNIFRRVIPPLGGLDFSPILAIFLLQFVAQAVTSAVPALAMGLNF